MNLNASVGSHDYLDFSKNSRFRWSKTRPKQPLGSSATNGRN